MISEGPTSKNRSKQTPVFIVSHSQQEEVCRQVYEYLTVKKIQKLKEAILKFNETVKRLLK